MQALFYHNAHGTANQPSQSARLDEETVSCFPIVTGQVRVRSYGLSVMFSLHGHLNDMPRLWHVEGSFALVVDADDGQREAPLEGALPDCRNKSTISSSELILIFCLYQL